MSFQSAKGSRSENEIERENEEKQDKENGNPKGLRYSKGHNRYSFDVQVTGPFYKTIDKKRPPPRMRSVATLAMMVEEVPALSLLPVDDMETPDWDYDDSTESSEKFAGGDAFSSTSYNEDEDEDSKDEDSSSKAEVCKRQEAMTMARPRGYRELDLWEGGTMKTGNEIVMIDAASQTNLEVEKEKLKSKLPPPKDNIIWPTIDEFDIDVATTRIEEYIRKCWTLDPKWMFTVKPLEVYHDNYRKKHVFEVKFSIPSAPTPVPPATASVFFVFEFPTYPTKADPISVSYVLEGTRFPHKPGRIPFQDKWLWGILTDKLRIQKAVNF